MVTGREEVCVLQNAATSLCPPALPRESPRSPDNQQHTKRPTWIECKGQERNQPREGVPLHMVGKAGPVTRPRVLSQFTQHCLLLSTSHSHASSWALSTCAVRLHLLLFCFELLHLFQTDAEGINPPHFRGKDRGPRALRCWLMVRPPVRVMGQTCPDLLTPRPGLMPPPRAAAQLAPCLLPVSPGNTFSDRPVF